MNRHPGSGEGPPHGARGALAATLALLLVHPAGLAAACGEGAPGHAHAMSAAPVPAPAIAPESAAANAPAAQPASATASAAPATTAPAPAFYDPDSGIELIGKPAPPWLFQRWVRGGPYTLAQLRGKVVLMRFWTEQCRFCETTLP